MNNLVAYESIVKCKTSYKTFSSGKSYKIKGFGYGKDKRQFWVFMSLFDNNIEFKVFKDTTNKLILDGVISSV